MEKQEMSRTLSEIVEHTRAMLSSREEERILNYQTLDPLLLKLEADLARTPNPHAAEKLAELKVHLIAIARLDDADGYSDEEHSTSAMKIIDELRGTGEFQVE